MILAPRPRLAMLMIMAALGLAGCRTAGTESIARNRAPAVQPLETAFDLNEFVAEHNRNAELISSVEARPAITITMGPQGDTRSGAVAGHLAVERPRNFKLELATKMSTIADIGSNDERFWFWYKNSKDRSVYFCDYADLNSTNLAVSYQPDWIVEAMGLKEISTNEAARIRIRPGPDPGTTLLTFAPRVAGGQKYSRVMVVSDSTRRVKEFRVISVDGKEVIAQASIKKYRKLPVDAGEPDPASSADRPMCVLPESIVLQWKKELLTLDVVLKDARVNQFDTSKRTARFVQPTISGYTAVNLAEAARRKQTAGAGAGATAVRESIPVPEPKAHVRLAPPASSTGDDTTANLRGQRNKDRSSNVILLPIVDLDVVEAPVPTAPGDPAAGVGTSLAVNPGIALER